MWWMVLACGGGGPAEGVSPEVPLVEVAPDAAPAAAPGEKKPALGAPPKGAVVEIVYVQASMLRLRPEPKVDNSMEKVERLSINTPLRKGAASGEWIAVTAPDGRTGFVHGDFVSPERLTAEALTTAIEAETDPKKALSLWQRKAALLSADPEVLVGLAGAYRAAGDEAAAEQVEAARVDDLGEWGRYFPQQHVAIASVTSRLAEVKTDTELIEVWREAQKVAASMEEPLNTHFMSEDGADYERVDAMNKAYVPWGSWGNYAEGTYLAMELHPEVWTQAAAKTEGEGDDKLFALNVAAYGNADGSGWAAWQDRNWDYGGCSPLGNGKNTHLNLLKAYDELRAWPDIVPSAESVRSGVLKDIEQPEGPGFFPYCHVATGLTPLEDVNAEVRAILEQVQLTDAEKAMLNKRIADKFEPREGEPF